MKKSIKEELLSGVYYTAIAKYAGIVISLLVVAILARIISPEDFGVVAIATVLIQFLGNFTDLGLEPAIVQKKDLSKRDLSNIFSFTFWIGILISIIFVIASWPISKYYENTTLLYICQLLSLNLFFATVNIVPSALLYKEKRFRFIAFRTLLIQLLTGVISIIAALSGFGLYSLVISPILSSLIMLIVNFRQYPQKLYFSLGLSSMRQIFSYSLYQFLFGVINYFSRNLDKLIIGKFLGLTLLGFYEKSYRLMMLPLQNISHVVGPVMHPVFSEFQNDFKSLIQSYEKVVKFLAYIGFPLSVVLFFTAEELVVIIFGNDWMQSIPAFEILSFSVGTQIILSTAGSIFQATNSTKTLFICGVLNTIVTVSGMIISVLFFETIEAVSWAVSITFVMNFFLTYIVMYYFLFKKPIWSLFSKLIHPLVLSSIIGVANFIYDIFPLTASTLLSLIIKSLISFIIFISYIQILGEYDLLKEGMSYLQKFKLKFKV